MLQRRTPLKRTGKLNAVRKVPRTNRMKANARFPSKHEERYWASLPKVCVACGATDTVIHHILARIPQKVRQRDHRFVVRLCATGCHNFGPDAVHTLGSEAAFFHRAGVDLVKIAVANWESFSG
jgi:hypothetical protein